MLCNVCEKNQATVHLTEIVDNHMSELHLCEECARQKSAQMEQQFGLSELLAGMADLGKPLSKDLEAEAVKCPNCGLSYVDFKKLGRLGCGECYTTFKKFLAPLLKKIHGSVAHYGKSPLKTFQAPRKKVDLQELRRALQEAIENEDFEKAASLRDQIRALEESALKEEKK